MRLSEVLEITDDIGLSSYPIFDPDYRAALNQKIIDHYFTQEIGTESVEMFRFFLRRKMNEIMPIYNKLYLSERLSIDPLNTMSIKTVNVSNATNTTNIAATSDATNSSAVDAEARAVSSSTPQMRLRQDGDYATGAQDNVSRTSTEAGASESTTQAQTGAQAAESSTLVAGWQGSQSEMLLRYRETFLNIDMMIIDELGTLFMLVWGNGDNTTPNRYYAPGFPLYGIL